MSGIRLIVGLGNIGREYARTRHNVGFWFVDELARRRGAIFATEARFHGAVARVVSSGRQVWLLKPSTYMNRSGQSVAALAGFYKIDGEQILVVHDELDLQPGDSKLKLGGGAAGHNGLKDIRARLGNASFWRLRIGIGHPRDLGLRQQVADYVLHPPSPEHLTQIERELDRGLDVFDDLVAGMFEHALLKLHTARGTR